MTNAHGGTTRYETDATGKEYIVAPVVMLVPGVHNGSDGPLFYPPEELAANPAAWDGKPVTVGHPPGGRAYNPANTPTVGRVRNARFAGGKLRAEAWLDTDALVYHTEELYNALESGGTVEVSTGLYTENEHNPGTAPCGVPYTYVARNYQPDHLAILLGQQGACSIAAGCGMPVANANTTNKDKPMKHGDDGGLPLPTMNFGNDEPVTNATDDDGGLPLPTMNFGNDEPVTNATDDDGGLPLPTMNFGNDEPVTNATDDDGGLPLPVMNFGTPANAPTTNEDEDGEGLPLPVMDFGPPST